MHKPRNPENGNILITLAVSIVVLLGLAGMAIDLVMSFAMKAALRNAVDAALLAAARAPSNSAQSVADMQFNANYPTGYMNTTSINRSPLTITGSRMSMTANVVAPSYFMHVFGRTQLRAGASGAVERPAATEMLVIDEEGIDEGLSTVTSFVIATRCGGGSNGNANVCTNDDIANPGVRTTLFTRGRSGIPRNGFILRTGQIGDEGLFRFTRPDPQISQQNGAQFTIQQFRAASGPAANENNLDKISDVIPLRTTQLTALVGRTVCAVVYDSDVSVDTSAHFANLKGATMGLTAFTVTAIGTANGSNLPPLTVNLLSAAQVTSTCASAAPNPTTSTSSIYLTE
jgi:hypothetical protein